ncbi:hypothetical protein L0128_02715 [candidate division KSB1 bacterium]|nr:hypothetical protein [candidate division KSB1 bacterium]
MHLEQSKIKKNIVKVNNKIAALHFTSPHSNYVDAANFFTRVSSWFDQSRAVIESKDQTK